MLTIRLSCLPTINQIRVVAFNVPQLTQASFLQKKSNVAKRFFDICNAEMAQSLSSLQKSEFLKLIILILIFHVKKLLVFLNFLVFFQFFLLKLVYF
jgi:hypothetical protein